MRKKAPTIGSRVAGGTGGYSDLGVRGPICDKVAQDVPAWHGMRISDPLVDEPEWSWRDELLWTSAGVVFAFSLGGFIGAATAGIGPWPARLAARFAANLPAGAIEPYIGRANPAGAGAFGLGMSYGAAAQTALNIFSVGAGLESAAVAGGNPVPAPEPIEGPDDMGPGQTPWYDYLNPVRWGEWLAEGYYGPEHAPIYSPDQPWIPGAGFDQSLFEWLSHQAYGGATPLSPAEGGIPDLGRMPSFWEFAQEITSDFYGTPIGPAYEPGGFYSPIPATVSPPVSVLPPGHAVEDIDPTFVPFF